MRRPYKHPSYIVLVFIVLYITVGCESKADGTPILPNRYVKIDFTATTEGANGPIINKSNEPLLITKGEEVIFKDISKEVTEDLLTGSKEETAYTEEVTWELEGADPMTASGKSTIVGYNTVGFFDVTVKTIGISGLVAVDSTFTDYVHVVEPPVKGYYLASEVFDDGRSAEYVVNSDSHQLELVNYSINNTLVEFHLFDYDSAGRLETQRFYDAFNEMLGTRGLIYDSDSQVVNDKTVDDEDNIVLDVNINWENGFAVDGTYTQRDGSGQTTTVELNFTDDGENILQVDYLLNNIRIGYEVYGFDQNEKPYAGFGNIESFPNYLNRNNLKSKTTYDSNNAIVELVERGIIYDSDIGDLPIEITETKTGMNPIIIDLSYNWYDQ